MSPKVRRAIPVLPSLDLARTRAFYVETLGFAVLFEVPGRTGLGRDGVEIQFWPIDNPGAAPNAPPTAQEWGFHEFGLIDPDSNLLMFAERIAGWREPS